MKKSKLDQDQKLEVVVAMLRKEEPISVLARRYRVIEQTLYRLRDRFLELGKAGLMDGGYDAQTKEIKRLEKKLRERDLAIDELTVANRI